MPEVSTANHVFVVPNALAEITARAVVDSLDLPSSQVNFVCTRKHVSGSEEIASHHLPFGWDDFPFGRGIRAIRMVVNRFDEWVQATLGDRFEIYIPHYGMPSYQLLATAASCQSVSYIEEGTIAFLGPADGEKTSVLQSGPLRNWLVSRLAYRGRVSRRVEVFQGVDRRCFRISPNAFPGRERVSHVEARTRSGLGNPEDWTAGLVLCSRKRFDDIWSRQTVQRVIERLIAWCDSNEVRAIYVRAHPGEMGADSVSAYCVEALALRGIGSILLPPARSVEEFLLASESHIALTLGSSLEFYDWLFAGRVVNGLALLAPEPALEAAYVGRLPWVLRERARVRFEARMDDEL